MALYYGFVEPNSARDAYIFTFSISESDPYLRDKLQIAKAKELEETAYFDVFMDRDLPASMLPYLRLVALKDTDAFLLESTFRDSIWDILALQVSRANEEMVCKMVIDACKSALSGYATTIEEVCITWHLHIFSISFAFFKFCECIFRTRSYYWEGTWSQDLKCR